MSIGHIGALGRLGLTQAKGVPQYLLIDGVLAILLLGADGQPLMGADFQYLYGRAA